MDTRRATVAAVTAAAAAIDRLSGSAGRAARSCVRVVVEPRCAVHTSALIGGPWMSLRKPRGWQREWLARRMSRSDGQGCITSTRAWSACAATGKISSFPFSMVCTNALQFTWNAVTLAGFQSVATALQSGGSARVFELVMRELLPVRPQGSKACSHDDPGAPSPSCGRAAPAARVIRRHCRCSRCRRSTSRA